MIASLIELPTLDLPGGGVTAGLSTADKQVRVLLRDLSGKSSWDASILYRTPESIKAEYDSNYLSETLPKTASSGSIQPESLMIGSPLHTLPQRAMRHRPPNVLPEVSNAAPDLDQLDDVGTDYLKKRCIVIYIFSVTAIFRAYQSRMPRESQS